MISQIRRFEPFNLVQSFEQDQNKIEVMTEPPQSIPLQVSASNMVHATLFEMKKRSRSPDMSNSMRMSKNQTNVQVGTLPISLPQMKLTDDPLI